MYPPPPPPVEVIVEKTEFDPALVPVGLTDPPAPTVTGIAPADAVIVDPAKGFAGKQFGAGAKDGEANLKPPAPPPPPATD